MSVELGYVSSRRDRTFHSCCDCIKVTEAVEGGDQQPIGRRGINRTIGNMIREAGRLHLPSRDCGGCFMEDGVDMKSSSVTAILRGLCVVRDE